MVWECCNDTFTGGRGDCEHPLSGDPSLGEPFRAPAPDQLLPYFTIPASGYNPLINLSSNAPPMASCNHNLTAGASAGIGVGVGLGTALVVIGAGLWVQRHRRRRGGAVSGQDRAPEAQQQQRDWGNGDGPYAGTPKPKSHNAPQELDNMTRRPELQA